MRPTIAEQLDGIARIVRRGARPPPRRRLRRRRRRRRWRPRCRRSAAAWQDVPAFQRWETAEIESLLRDALPTSAPRGAEVADLGPDAAADADPLDLRALDAHHSAARDLLARAVPAIESDPALADVRDRLHALARERIGRFPSSRHDRPAHHPTAADGGTDAHPLDDTPWHQLATTFDHVGTSDSGSSTGCGSPPRTASGTSALQFTIGVYQNMNVVDGGFVVIVDGHQHNLPRLAPAAPDLRDRRAARCASRWSSPSPTSGSWSATTPTASRGELDWNGVARRPGGAPALQAPVGQGARGLQPLRPGRHLRGWLEVDGRRRELDEWWACRDHSWGVRERVGITEPFTGEVAPQGSRPVRLPLLLDRHPRRARAGRPRRRRISLPLRRSRQTGPPASTSRAARSADVAVAFVDDRRPRRMRRRHLRGDRRPTVECHASRSRPTGRRSPCPVSATAVTTTGSGSAC